MNSTVIKVGDKEIDVKEDCVYVTIGHRTFYLENSDAAPMYCTTWIDGEPQSYYEAQFKKEKLD